jgi:archaellum component FlaF (FlaF/FlaG flagellin family)
MRSTNILPIEKRRGVSTILGTLIFIGILFTSVVPMMLVMKQADTIYTKKIHELETKDDERVREELIVYTFAGGGTKIMVKIKNRGEVPVKIVRVWTNDEYHNENTTILTNSENNIGPFEVPDVDINTTVSVKVVTERGNVFHCISGILYYTGSGWSTTSYGICVIIHNAEGGEYQCWLWNASKTEPTWDKFYESKSKEWEDVVATTPVPVVSPYYKVEVNEKKGINWKPLPGSPIDTPIEYPDGPPFIMVWIDAK